MKNVRRELVEETEGNIAKSVEGSRLYAEWLGKRIKEGQKRDKELMDKLVPLLKKETIDAIVQDNRIVYEVFKEEIPSDDSLLCGHLERMINDFDCNIYEMTEDDIPIVAKALNKELLKSYFIPGD